MATDTTSGATPSDAPANNTPFSWSIPLEISGDGATYLDRSQTNNNTEELSIPRPVIAEVIGGSRLVAELERPLKIGTYNELPAYLLQTHFSFQRANSTWLYRIQAAEITIVVEDAPASDATAKTAKQHPAVAAWYPKLFDGEASHAVVTESMSTALDAGYMGAGAKVGTEKSRTFLETGRVVVHGVRGGGRNRNSITWVIEQDSIQKSGIPRDIKLPLIVTRQSGGRFLARVTVKVHYGFWRGALARSIPVVGKNDEPLYFDPATVEAMAQNGEKGPDGTPVAELCGPFDGIDLKDWSSFP
ncbi:hypothetical protein CC80DRAFT_592202 [Byssothecium circinans]|uniref:Uncharacterized protein n=1 Tax=Byssothecium circinans TaxID=147558 RepID=A0A6A5TXV1_9PLEO|nr:hypothetical protein CC80DRAFT_592202 [Byssothecium circinans]